MISQCGQESSLTLDFNLILFSLTYLFRQLAEQKYTLDNLLGYLKKYESDAGVSEIIGRLNELQSDFSQLKEENVSGTTIIKKDKKIFGGGVKITITEKQYQTISDKIKDIRNSFTMTK